MRRLSKTVTLVGTTALSCAVALTAHAHDSGVATTTTTTTSFEAPVLDRRVPLNTNVYRAVLDAKLTKLATLVDTTRAKVAAIPSDKVLTGIERRVAKVRLARAARLDAILDAIPDSGMYAPTAAQRRRIAAIRADLDAIVTRLKSLLANEPAPVTRAPVETRIDKTETVKDTSEWWRRGCDGWDGIESWERHRDWDGWRDSPWRR